MEAAAAAGKKKEKKVRCNIGTVSPRSQSWPKIELVPIWLSHASHLSASLRLQYLPPRLSIQDHYTTQPGHHHLALIDRLPFFSSLNSRNPAILQ